MNLVSDTRNFPSSIFHPKHTLYYLLRRIFLLDKIMKNIYEIFAWVDANKTKVI